ncbi:MAG TPA: EpsG family protein [Paludibacter sp.]|nr:EpsG family protein [Paludibacter sp.]
MAVYWTIAILTVLINLYPLKKQRDYTVRLIVSLIPLFLYGAFRVDFGLDYKEYENFYNGVKVLGREADESFEIGYYYLNLTLSSFRSLLVFQTVLLCTAYYFLFKWYIPAKWAWLGFILLFLNGPQTIFFMLSGIRNGIAISIFILSSYFIYKRKIIPFTILIFIAYFFHQSVVLFAPAAYLIVNYISFNKKTLYIWLFIMLFFSIASNTIDLDYINLLVEQYFDRYNIYIENAMEEGQGAGLLIKIFSFIATFLLLLNVKYIKYEVMNIKNYNNKKKERVEKEVISTSNSTKKKRIVLFSAIKEKYIIILAKDRMITKMNMFFFLAFILGSLNLRMSQYFVSFFIVGIVMVMWKSSNRIFKYAYLVLIFMYLIYSFVIWVLNPFFSYSSYESILF